MIVFRNRRRQCDREPRGVANVTTRPYLCFYRTLGLAWQRVRRSEKTVTFVDHIYPTRGVLVRSIFVAMKLLWLRYLEVLHLKPLPILANCVGPVKPH